MSMLYLGNHKRCSKCGEERPLTEFRRHAQTEDGLTMRCKACAKRPGIGGHMLYLGDSKRCSKCGKYKDIRTGYHKNKTSTNGVEAKCKDCRREKWRQYRNQEDRFWKNFWPRTKRVGDCLVWTGTCNRYGMPRCHYKDRHDSFVRRVVYRLACGDLPDDMLVIMTCETPRCVSQHHMRLGTKSDLMVKLANRAATGDRNSARLHPERLARGERVGGAKLTESDVRAIRELRNCQQKPLGDIALQFGVTLSTVSSVATGKTWKHVQ